MGNAGRYVSICFVWAGDRCLLSPETFLTKICMVSDGSTELDREELTEEGILVLEMCDVEVESGVVCAVRG